MLTRAIYSGLYQTHGGSSPPSLVTEMLRCWEAVVSKDSQANQPSAEHSWRPKGRCCPVIPSLPRLDTAFGLRHTWAYQAQGLGACKRNRKVVLGIRPTGLTQRVGSRNRGLVTPQLPPPQSDYVSGPWLIDDIIMGEVTFGGKNSQLYTGEVSWSPVVAQVTSRSPSPAKGGGLGGLLWETYRAFPSPGQTCRLL